MDYLFSSFHKMLAQTKSGFVRYKNDEIKWEGRMLGLVGPRGVGKTTLFLQHIKQHLPLNRTLYVSADSLYFTDHTLVGLADAFCKQGGQYLFLDEIHKYGNWSRELKEIYDVHPDLFIRFTGSSVLDIYKGTADLSRRAPIYEMQGLSFREFLQLRHGIAAGVYSLEEIVGQRVELPIDHPLPLFREYLREGYYPYSTDADYALEVEQSITQTMESDIPQYANMNVSTGRKLKQLLMIVSRSVPFKPVMQKLAEAAGVSRNTVADYLLYMERAGMIAQLRDATGGIRGLGKVEKIYLDNTAIAYTLSAGKPDVGNLRETFFMNQMRVRNEVITSKLSDFEIDGMTFEVGGKGKGKKQVAQAERGFVVKDDIEFGYGNVVPLWAFGLNY